MCLFPWEHFSRRESKDTEEIICIDSDWTGAQPVHQLIRNPAHFSSMEIPEYSVLQPNPSQVREIFQSWFPNAFARIYVFDPFFSACVDPCKASKPDLSRLACNMQSVIRVFMYVSTNAGFSISICSCFISNPEFPIFLLTWPCSDALLLIRLGKGSVSNASFFIPVFLIAAYKARIRIRVCLCLPTNIFTLMRILQWGFSCLLFQMILLPYGRGTARQTAGNEEV